jgi:hypothetical protein
MLTKPDFSTSLSLLEREIDPLHPRDCHESLDIHIDAAESYLRSLRTLRNCRAQISVLPPEILCMICERATGSLPSYFVTTWRRLVDLTAVCKLWRDVLLNSPSYWSCFALTKSKHLPEMLARSKNHPFSLIVDMYSYCSSQHNTPDNETLTAIFAPKRLGSLHITGTGIHFQSLLDRFPETEAPSLSSLRISCPRSPSYIRLPPRVFTVPKPALQHLYLDRCAVDWCSVSAGIDITVPNLLTLEVCEAQPPLPYNILFSLLSSSSKLQKLKLDSAIQSHSERPEGEEDNDSIALSQLEHFHVVGEFLACCHLASSLLRPVNCATFLVMKEGQSKPLDTDYHAGIDKVLASCRLNSSSEKRPLSRLVHTAELSTQNSTSSSVVATEIILFEQQPSPRPTWGRKMTNLDVSNPPFIYLGFHRLVLDYLLLKLAVPGVQQLEINLNDVPSASKVSLGQRSATSLTYPTVKRWTHFFKRHSSIQQVTLASEDILSVLSSLGSPPSTSPPAKVDPPLPYLINLELRNVVFEDDVKGDTYLDLEIMLLGRIDHKVPIPQISIVSSRYFDESMQSLLNDIDEDINVEWDGDYMSEPEEEEEEEEDDPDDEPYFDTFQYYHDDFYDSDDDGFGFEQFNPFW